MATSDVIKTMDGMGSNPGLLIKAPDYIAPGAEIVYSNNYYEGKAVRGTYKGQKIMESPWFQAGTFNNIVIPMLYIEGDKAVTGMTNSASHYTDKVKIIIYKRLPGASTFTTTEIFVSYTQNISNKIGQAPHREDINRPSWNPTWFDIRYEYKFAVEVYQITAGAALDVEGIYLQYYITNSVMTGRQVQYGSGTMAQAIPVIAGVYWTATTDGAGNLSIALPSEFFPYSAGFTTGEAATGSPPASVGPALRPVINSVDAVQTSFEGGSDISAEYLLWNYEVVDSSNGGYTIYVGLHSDSPNTAYQFSTFVFGYSSPMVV